MWMCIIFVKTCHEFGHATQKTFEFKTIGPSSELQADCLAGVFIKEGNFIFYLYILKKFLYKDRFKFFFYVKEPQTIPNKFFIRN